MVFETDVTVYEFVGGAETFRRLVNDFYARVEADAGLRHLFPEDLEPGKEYQFLFLSQYFGGPTTYSERRGHPRLRMRHMPYAIDQGARSAWLSHMLAAVDATSIAEPARSIMCEYFIRASEAMINTYHPHEDEQSDGA